MKYEKNQPDSIHGIHSVDESIQSMRTEYLYATLDEADLAHEPHDQLQKWIKNAQEMNIVDANAFALATTDLSGNPSVRTLLLRGLSTQGAIFYTNNNSLKGKQLSQNPKAEMLFFWREMNRQVRIHGVVETLPDSQVTTYFHSRPLGSQQASMASDQSQPIRNREELDAKLLKVQRQYPKQVPVPKDWQGYQLKPNYWEFWQGRQKRFHDRLAYRLTNHGQWDIIRLQP